MTTLTVRLPLTADMTVKHCTLVKYGDKFISPHIWEQHQKTRIGLIPGISGMLLYTFDYTAGNATIKHIKALLKVNEKGDLQLIDARRLKTNLSISEEEYALETHLKSLR